MTDDAAWEFELPIAASSARGITTSENLSARILMVSLVVAAREKTPNPTTFFSGPSFVFLKQVNYDEASTSRPRCRDSPCHRNRHDHMTATWFRLPGSWQGVGLSSPVYAPAYKCTYSTCSSTTKNSFISALDTECILFLYLGTSLCIRPAPCLATPKLKRPGHYTQWNQQNQDWELWQNALGLFCLKQWVKKYVHTCLYFSTRTGTLLFNAISNQLSVSIMFIFLQKETSKSFFFEICCFISGFCFFPWDQQYHKNT